jgi:DASS family divalent anion:Na+ symporter
MLILLGLSAPFPGMEIQAKTALIIFLICIVFWIFRPLPEYLSAFLGGVAFITVAGIPGEQVFSGFSTPVWWMGVLSMVLGITINDTGLGRRIVFMLLSLIGGTPLRILYSTTMVNNLLAPFIPTNTARGALLCGITDSLCDSLGYERGGKKGDHTIMLANMYINTTNTFMFLTAMEGNLLCVKIIAESTGRTITWMEWLCAGFVPGLPLLLIFPYLVNRMFPMQPPPAGISGAETARKKLRELGPMSRAEWSTAIIMGLTMLLWLTGDLHKLTASTSSFTLILLLLPGIGAVSWEKIQARFPWPAMIWLGFAIGMAGIIDRLHGFKWLVDRLVADSAFFQNIGFTPFLAIMIVAIVFMHIIFAGMNAMVMVIVPISIALAKQLNFDAAAVGLVASMATTGGAFFMPFNSAPNLIFYATGRYDVRQQLAGAVPLAFLICIALLLGLLFWWPFIGVIK